MCGADDGNRTAFSAWERDSGSPWLWLWAGSSWFYVVELRRSGEISYTASYTDEDASPATKRGKARYAPDNAHERPRWFGGEPLSAATGEVAAVRTVSQSVL